MLGKVVTSFKKLAYRKLSIGKWSATKVMGMMKNSKIHSGTNG